MSWKIRRTGLAESDLLAIWDYVAADNPAAADRLIRAFEELLQKTADFPELGRPADEIRPGLRILTRNRYLLLYRPLASERVIELVRVVHSARDWPTLFDS